MFYLGRLISAFFNQLFRWLFWNKTGQKVLFTIVIFAIAICFIKLGEVSAVEITEDINYKAYNYYDSLTNDFIIRFSRLLNNNDATALDLLDKINNGYNIYLCYGQVNGGSYLNSYPASKTYLTCIVFNGSSFQQNATPTSADYMSITGYTIYSGNINNMVYRFSASSVTYTNNSSSTIYLPLQLNNYYTANFSYFISAYNSGDTQTMIELLENINESLSNTTPDQESEDSVTVDSSATDSVDTSEIDSVFSSAFTSFANKFTYYDLADADQWVITINGTRIVLKSDILYNMIKNTWFYPMLQLLWYYIFGHYAFVWLTNLIHKIKDGSILDGLEVNEVISKEML